VEAASPAASAPVSLAPSTELLAVPGVRSTDGTAVPEPVGGGFGAWVCGGWVWGGWSGVRGGGGAGTGDGALGGDCVTFGAAGTDSTVAATVVATSSTTAAGAEGVPATKPSRIAALAKMPPRCK
jgi:hypothetical protein